MPGSGWLLAAWMLVVPAGAAAQVYKCVDRDGTRYQSAPCAAGQETARVWQPADYAPPPAHPGVGQGFAWSAAAPRATGTRRSTGRAVARQEAGSSIGACEAARQKRDRELAAMGKAGRKIEVRRAADAKVATACR